MTQPNTPPNFNNPNTQPLPPVGVIEAPQIPPVLTEQQLQQQNADTHTYMHDLINTRKLLDDFNAKVAQDLSGMSPADAKMFKDAYAQLPQYLALKSKHDRATQGIFFLASTGNTGQVLDMLKTTADKHVDVQVATHKRAANSADKAVKAGHEATNKLNIFHDRQLQRDKPGRLTQDELSRRAAETKMEHEDAVRKQLKHAREAKLHAGAQTDLDNLYDAISIQRDNMERALRAAGAPIGSALNNELGLDLRDLHTINVTRLQELRDDHSKLTTLLRQSGLSMYDSLRAEITEGVNWLNYRIAERSILSGAGPDKATYLPNGGILLNAGTPDAFAVHEDGSLTRQEIDRAGRPKLVRRTMDGKVWEPQEAYLEYPSPTETRDAPIQNEFEIWEQDRTPEAAANLHSELVKFTNGRAQEESKVLYDLQNLNSTVTTNKTAAAQRQQKISDAQKNLSDPNFPKHERAAEQQIIDTLQPELTDLLRQIQVDELHIQYNERLLQKTRVALTQNLYWQKRLEAAHEDRNVVQVSHHATKGRIAMASSVVPQQEQPAALLSDGRVQLMGATVHGIRSNWVLFPGGETHDLMSGKAYNPDGTVI